jgi:diphthamide synthase (EF-2-diphthine--ammonia ligase)
VCIDPRVLDPSFAGQPYDATFLSQLPEGVDPCGENGEFHTFVYDGPCFRFPVRFEVGETVVRDGFAFRDLVEA